ncbi:unnamed protein product [Polarella glacialis]|uniref:Uncharacterized protein n=1 Tax=Polarella glacialis TaxID=89957 RepID=A0A813FMH4_POLGL|nr:unnamed protein product [Polarella glacialis]
MAPRPRAPVSKKFAPMLLRAPVWLSGPVAASPDFYLVGEVQSFAFISANDSAYLTGIEELKGSAIPENKYRSIADDLTDGDATYARITAGQYVGDNPSESGGYIGMASYLLKNGTISTNENDFLVPDGPGQSTTTSKSACIAELNTTTNTCGAALTYKTGDFKFSLFGFTTGSSFALPGGATYLGVRTKLTKKNFPADVAMTFNGKAKTLAGSTAIGTSDVTSMELTGNNRSLTIDFPQKYNVGNIAGGEASTPTATKDVKIKVAAVDGDADSIYVDYLFGAADLQAAGKYFVYAIVGRAVYTVAGDSATLRTVPPGFLEKVACRLRLPSQEEEEWFNGFPQPSPCMKSVTSRVVLLLSAAGSAKALTWVKAGNGSQAACAGVEEVCSDAASCTRVAFGPCGGLASPDFYLVGEVQSFAFISANDSAYLTGIQELKGSAIPENKYRSIADY